MSDVTRPILPYLFYEDVEAALAWLAKCFGLRERTEETMRNDAGAVVHAAMETPDGAVVLMGMPPDFEAPLRHGKVNGLLYVYVDDVEGHCARARAAGAPIASGPEDTFYGDRRYATVDCEGHHWTFAQKLREWDPGTEKPGAGDLEGHG